MALWRAVLNFDTTKARPQMGLRHTVGVVVPVALGALLGSPGSGLVAGLGALNVAVGDGTDAYSRRAQRMLVASLCCGVAVAAGGLAGGTPAISIILAAGAFVAGVAVALGTAAENIALITLVNLIVFSAQGMPWRQALLSGLLALSGGLLQTALALALWPLRRNQPEREALGALYHELARAAEAGSPAAEAPPASRESTAAQQTLASLDARDSIQAERYLALLGQAERIRLALLALARLRVRIAREAGTGAETGILNRCAAVAARALRHVGGSLEREGSGQPPPEFAQDLARSAVELRKACGGCSPAARSMMADARIQIDALAGQLRTALDLSAQTTERGLAEFERREAAHPWKLRFAGTRSAIAANLGLESAAFRHGVRLAVAVIVGEFLAQVLHWRRPYWAPMTVALVLKPDYVTTFSRGFQRVLGTLAGLVVATAIFHFLAPPLWVHIGFLAVFVFVLRAYGPANYGIMAIGVTGLVVFLFAIEGVAPGDVILARGLNTLLGGAIALLAYRLWPTWERTQAPEALARMLDAYRAYFRAVRDGYVSPDADIAALDRVRLAARVARSNLEASIARMRAEPGALPGRIAAFDRMLADSHRFIHAVMALEAGFETSRPVPARDTFRTLANDVDVTLYYLAASLRGVSIPPSHLPDLREDHHALIESGDPAVERYALVNIETDRMVNSLNTLAAAILPLG